MLLAPSLPLPNDGGGGSPRELHPTSQGSMAALCLPPVLDWRRVAEVGVRPPSLGVIRFHFPVVARLPAVHSGTPRLWGQPRAAAVVFPKGRYVLCEREEP